MVFAAMEWLLRMGGYCRIIGIEKRGGKAWLEE